MVLPIIVKIPVYIVVGFVEMLLATQRTVSVTRGQKRLAGAIVFLENFVSFFIFYQIITDLPNNWFIFIAYSVGCALGTMINLEKYTIQSK